MRSDAQAKGKILVVDESRIALSATRLILESAGFEVAVLVSPLRLPLAVQRETPDIVLLGLDMPTLSGDRVVRIAKKTHFLQGVPVYLYSRCNEADLARIAVECGADGYVWKSSDPGILIRQVEEKVRSARADAIMVSRIRAEAVTRRMPIAQALAV